MEKKPPVLAEEKLLPKAAPEPSRAPESAAPKGKSTAPKPETESKEIRGPTEAPRLKEHEVSCQGVSSSEHPWGPHPIQGWRAQERAVMPSRAETVPWKMAFWRR